MFPILNEHMNFFLFCCYGELLVIDREKYDMIELNIDIRFIIIHIFNNYIELTCSSNLVHNELPDTQIVFKNTIKKS